MYPFLRTVKELIKYRMATRLPIGGVHVSHHICWPWDLDMWGELNNGRTLSIFALKRLAFNLIHILPRRRSSNIREE